MLALQNPALHTCSCCPRRADVTFTVMPCTAPSVAYDGLVQGRNCWFTPLEVPVTQSRAFAYGDLTVASESS